MVTMMAQMKGTREEKREKVRVVCSVVSVWVGV